MTRAGLCRAGRLFRLAASALTVLVLIAAPLPAYAVNPDEVIPDLAMESRARTLSSQLRCMVCQNQSIDDSNAELAKDLRLLVRERIKDGDSDEQVLNYVVSRYGEFVLLKPRFGVRTVMLWGAPVVLILSGVISLILAAVRRRSAQESARLTSEEERKLAKLLDRSGV